MPEGPEDDPIETIIVVDGGTGGLGSLDKDYVKACAGDAYMAIKYGGGAFVVIGGVLMLVGFDSAWTGVGAGVFVGGGAFVMAGGAAYMVGEILEQTWKDPPQAKYRRACEIHLERLLLPDWRGKAPEAMVRVITLLLEVKALSKGILDAMERMQGASARKDVRWMNAHRRAASILIAAAGAKERQCAAALAALAKDKSMKVRATAKEVKEGISALRRNLPAMKVRMLRTGLSAGFVKQMEAMLSGLERRPPRSVDLADALRGMSLALSRHSTGLLNMKV